MKESYTSVQIPFYDHFVGREMAFEHTKHPFEKGGTK